eukprot:evm.model.scf_667.1 EVM.evm.TU.scf_667.1   scf_667:5473-12959(+)
MDAARPDASGSTDDEGDYYAVEKLLAMRVRKGVRKFKVRWRGCGPDEDQWVEDADLGEDPMSFKMESSLLAQLQEEASGNAAKPMAEGQRAAPSNAASSPKSQKDHAEDADLPPADASHQEEPQAPCDVSNKLPADAQCDEANIMQEVQDAPCDLADTKHEEQGKAGRAESGCTENASVEVAAAELTVDDMLAATTAASDGMDVDAPAPPCVPEVRDEVEKAAEPPELVAVEMLLSRKEVADGTVLYLVRWEGMGPEQDIWVPDCNLERPVSEYKMTADVAAAVGMPHIGARKGCTHATERAKQNSKWKRVEELCSERNSQTGSEPEEMDVDDEAENNRVEVGPSLVAAAAVTDADGGEDGDDDEFYEVERIVDMKTSPTKSGKRLSFKVRWKGYGSDEDTWVQEGDLGDKPSNYSMEPKVQEKLERIAKTPTPQKKRKRASSTPIRGKKGLGVDSVRGTPKGKRAPKEKRTLGSR